MAAISKPHPAIVTQPTPGAPDTELLNAVESPASPPSVSVISRFEFETDRGNEGTKILMVEWDSSAAAAGKESKESSGKQDSSDWEVSWEGKTHVLPVRDSDPKTGGVMKRVFFLLPPGASIPSLVNISQRSGEGVVLRTKPMPAIFPTTLGSSNKEAGKRGVLHSIWAKKRLSELEAEITAEMKANGESVGLEMAIQERDWITDHFGVGEPSDGNRAPYTPSPKSPTTMTAGPRSPIGGRLGEKLRGLKLATTPAELAAASQASKSHPSTTLSPQTADVAVSSYATFQGRSPTKKSAENNVASLDAVTDGEVPPVVRDDTEEELFALPMSPRSPEMAKSPFSLL